MSSTFSAKDIKELEHALLKASELLKSEVKYEDTVVFLGASRSGKSCVMNWSIGNKLVGRKDPDIPRINLEKGDDSPGPKIGLGSIAETTIPTRWDSGRFPHLGLWDLPGFVDNRGVIQDITNAFYILELFINIKSAKIVIVIDVNDIVMSNINSVLSLLRSLEDIFGTSMKRCFDSIAVIFTKVPLMIEDGPADKECIIAFLKSQFLKNSQICISGTGKSLISYLVNHDQNIGLYRKVPAGPVSDQYIDIGITDAINNINSVPEEILKQVSPSISEQSKLALFKARGELCYKKAMIGLQNRIVTFFEEKFMEIQRIKNDQSIPHERYHTFNEEFYILGNHINAFLNQPNPEDHLYYLKFIDNSFAKLIDAYNLIERFKLMRFVDRMLKTEESTLYDFGLKEIILNAQIRVHEVIMWLKVQLNEASEEKAMEKVSEKQKEFLQRIEDLQSKFEQSRRKNEESMQLFASAGYVVDRSFELIGKSVLKLWDILLRRNQ